MTAPVLTVSALAALTLFMVVSLFTAGTTTHTLQAPVAAIAAPAANS